MNQTIHLNSETLRKTNNVSLTFRVSPNRNFSLIAFFMFAPVLILRIWIQASCLHEALTGVHLWGESSVKPPTSSTSSTTTLRAQICTPYWCTLVGGKQCKAPYEYYDLACTKKFNFVSGASAGHQWESNRD